MYDGKMTIRLSMLIDVDNNEDYQELKTLQNHIDRLLDLDSWPEIKSVYGVTVETSNGCSLPYNKVLGTLQNYVSNDYEAAESEYVINALENAGCSRSDFKELGFEWLLDLEEGNDVHLF